MSEIFTAIKDIVNLVNEKYGANMDIEPFSVLAYTPKLDENKEKFSVDDRKWILQQIKSFNFSGGVPGVIKRMDKKFNNSLKQSIKDASRMFGDLEGVIKFLVDYEKMLPKLPRNDSPGAGGKTQELRLDISEPVAKAKKRLLEVKNTFDQATYEDSFYEYTEKVVQLVKSYQLSKDKSNKFELEMLSIFTGSLDEDYNTHPELAGPANSGLIKGWRKLKDNYMVSYLKDIYDNLKEEVPSKEYSFKDLKRDESEKSTPLEKKVRALRMKPVEVSEKDIEISKEMKKDKKDRDLEITKHVTQEERYTFYLDRIEKYLADAKKRFPNSGATGEKASILHDNTDALCDIIRDYLGKKDRDNKVTKSINSLFTSGPAILTQWKDIYSVEGVKTPIAKDVQGLKTSFAQYAKDLNAPTNVNENIIGAVSKLSIKRGKYTAQDVTIAKALLGKTPRKVNDPGISKSRYPGSMDSDIPYFNKLDEIVDTVMKHHKELPTKPKMEDLKEIKVPKEDLNEKYLDTFSKSFGFLNKILKEEGGSELTNKELSDKIINLFKNQESIQKKLKEDQKKREDDAAFSGGNPKPIKQKEKDEKTKKSSINIINDYKGSIYHRLDSLVNISQDKLVKAELEDIAQEIKHIL